VPLAHQLLGGGKTTNGPHYTPNKMGQWARAAMAQGEKEFVV